MAKAATATAPRLKALYSNQYAKELQAELNLTNVHQVPKLEKIVVSVGTGKSKDDKRTLEAVKNTLTKITGQAPVEQLAKKSIAGFKIRAGMGAPVGMNVTLRGARMYEFLDRLISIAIPRIRDFRGISARSFDGRGNFNMGVREQIIFPEIEYDKIDAIRGLNISITTTAKTDAEAKALLAAFKFPFKS